MNSRHDFPLAAAIVLGGVTVGCADVGRTARHSDGLLDFLGSLAAGHPRRDVMPVERISGRAGEIVAAHAEAAGTGATRVSGIVRNGFGYSEVYQAHIDVKVLGAGHRLVAAFTTDYSPRPIPVDYRGQPRRAAFSARLPFVPAAGSTVQVAFHQTQRADCEFNRLTLTGKP